MINLQNNIILLIMSSILVGCTTVPYKVFINARGQVHLTVKPERIILDCSDVGSDEGEYYGFSMFILDNINTVISVSQTNKLDKESCYERISKINKIKKNAQVITIHATGNPNESISMENNEFNFPKIGKFKSNGRDLQFIYIFNDKGQCYGAYTAEDSPCPDDF